MRGMNMLSVQGQGLIFTVIIFLCCVIVVHAFVLAKIYRTLHKKLPPEQPPKEPKKSDPVYYIVEKKKKRVKSEYTAPREIKFK